MDWISDVQDRIKRKNQILFAKDSVFLGDLSTLIDEQNHQILILWAFEFADEAVEIMSKRYPKEPRLATAVQLSKDWAVGKEKMPVVQRAILQAHAVAKELDSPEDVAICHAIGQACGVVHTKGHAIGFPIYELTSIIRHHGIPECKPFVETRKNQYIERLIYWRENYKDYPYEWAPFILKNC